MTNMHITGVPKGENRAEKIFEAIMAKTFPKCVKVVHRQTAEIPVHVVPWLTVK